jgi:hypothetical protein
MTKENETKTTEQAATETAGTEKQALETVNKQLPSTASGAAYITELLTKLQEEFLLANAGMQLDFVNMGTWLHLNKKGNFEELDNPAVCFGDTLDVVIGYGEQRWSIWGEKDTEDDGRMIVARTTKEDAQRDLDAFLAEFPDKHGFYNHDSIKLRYISYVVTIQHIKEAAANGEFPKVYLLAFSPTDTFGFGKYARDIFNGNDSSKAVGIPQRIGVNRVITRLYTVTKKGRRSSEEFNSIECQPMGLFNPADFGIGNAEQPQE